MAKHVATNPVIAAFADSRVKLPLRLSDEDLGVILDDDGADVITIDSNGIRPDASVLDIACLVVTAINHFAGFQETPDAHKIPS